MSAFMFMNKYNLKNLYDFKNSKNILNNTSSLGTLVNTLVNDVSVESFGADIKLNQELGTSSRSFSGKVRVSRNRDYQSILVLVYFDTRDDNDPGVSSSFGFISPSKKFPNRMPSYRNHFCVYTGLNDTLLIVRSETTLCYDDHDAILQYDLLTLSDNMFTTMCRKRWMISYDSCSSTSTKRPDDFLNYTLCCSGEWWYFDKGIILNGTHEKYPCFIYYELHDRTELLRKPASNLTMPVTRPNPSNSSNGIVVNNDGDVNNNNKMTIDPPMRNQLPKFAQLVSEGDYDGTVGTMPIAADTDKTGGGSETYYDFIIKPLPKPRLRNILPSSWWFTERDRELFKRDIKYFIPL